MRQLRPSERSKFQGQCWVLVCFKGSPLSPTAHVERSLPSLTSIMMLPVLSKRFQGIRAQDLKGGRRKMNAKIEK